MSRVYAPFLPPSTALPLTLSNISYVHDFLPSILQQHVVKTSRQDVMYCPPRHYLPCHQKFTHHVPETYTRGTKSAAPGRLLHSRSTMSTPHPRSIGSSPSGLGDNPSQPPPHVPLTAPPRPPRSRRPSVPWRDGEKSVVPSLHNFVRSWTFPSSSNRPSILALLMRLNRAGP